MCLPLDRKPFTLSIQTLTALAKLRYEERNFAEVQGGTTEKRKKVKRCEDQKNYSVTAL